MTTKAIKRCRGAFKLGQQLAQKMVSCGSLLDPVYLLIIYSCLDIGVLFLEDESGDSSAQEEDGSEDGESDDHSDEFNFNDQQLERRSTNSNARSDLAPQTMQWAIRSPTDPAADVCQSRPASVPLSDA